MTLITISNLFPRPDQPQRGLFNAELFEAMADVLRIQDSGSCVQNVCLVPEWRIWKWPKIMRWNKQYSESGIQISEFNIQTIYCPVFYLPLIGRNLSWWFYGLSLAKLVNKTEGYNAVFSTWLYPDGVTATRFAVEVGLPAWIMVQGSDTFHLENPIRRKMILKACSKAKGIICVCKALADRIIDAGVDVVKVHVVPNGLDSKLFKYRGKEEVYKELQAVVQHSAFSIQHSKIILFVSNLVPVKGPDIMLKIWATLVTRSRKSEVSNQNLQLMIIGDGNLRKKLEKQVIELGVSNSVIFLGNRPHEEVALWMNAVDCLCLPSRTEGMPNVVIEALASGLPVVATDVGGVSELLKNEPGARIVPIAEIRNQKSEVGGPSSGSNNGDVIARFAKYISEIFREDVDRKAMAERNKGRFSWKKQAETILGLMNGVKVVEKTSE
ncbi:MAG: glycosyltransferase [Kiritimatiellae bacterium]|nr:glycosyltransferase [Kiritimatiellia bacterium]MDD5521901.1 glycosyltransferase [Kiritimatiellia bacterium]